MKFLNHFIYYIASEKCTKQHTALPDNIIVVYRYTKIVSGCP